jgi:N6-L-threonylcarbamoyladenine synthase
VHFIKEIGKEKKMPSFPFLCLLVSGGHSQIVLVQDYLSMQILGQTIDDAAGEAFDKCAKVMGFPYPGGPVIDKLARDGNPHAFKFNKPRIDGLNYSFSGFKTSFLYFFRNMMKEDRNFVENFKNDICASIQFTIIDILLEKLILAAKQTGIHEIAIAGGVSANSGLRETLHKEAVKRGWKLYIPEIKYTTDNAAMIAITGFYKFIVKKFASQTVVPVPRIENIQDTYF